MAQAQFVQYKRKWGKMTKLSRKDLELEKIRAEIPLRHKLFRQYQCGGKTAAALLILKTSMNLFA